MKLSPREREIISLYSQGYSRKEIAKMLFVSIKAVDFHTSNIYRKYRVHNRIDALKIYLAEVKP